MTAVLIAEKGSLSIDDGESKLEPGAFPGLVLQIEPGSRYPVLYRDFIVADEGSLVDPPADLRVIYVKKDAPYPVFWERD